MIHKEAEITTRHEKYLGLIASHAVHFFMLIDLQGKILFIDKTLPSFTKEEVIGSSIYDYQDEDNEQIMRNCIATVLRIKKPSTYEITAIVPEGEPIFYEGTVIPIIEDDKIEKLGIITIGITERKKTEIELVAYKKQYLDLLKRTNTVVFTQDKQLRYTSVISPILNIKEEEFIGKTDKELVGLSRKDAERLMELKKQVLREGISLRQNVRVSFSAETYYHDLLLNPIVEENGEIIGISGASIDITEKEKRKIALEKSEQRLKEAEKVAHLGHYYVDVTSSNLNWSEEIFRILGINPKEHIPDATNYIDLVVEEDKDLVRKAQQATLEKGIAQDIIYRIKRPDGNIRYLRNLNQARYDHSGAINRLFGTVQDITEQKELEFELNTQKELTQKILDVSPSLIFIIDIENQDNVFFNNASLQILGYREDEVHEGRTERQPNSLMPLKINRFNVKEFMHPADVAGVYRVYDDFFNSREDKIFDLEYRVKHKNGHWIWLHNRIVSFVKDANGVTVQGLGIASDISKLKEVEKTSKYALLNGQEQERQRIAADLHDAVNPLLSAAKLNIEAVRDRVNCDAEKKNLADIEALLAKAMHEIKDISVNLMPSTLRDFGLSYTLQDYCHKIFTGGTPTIDLNIHGLQKRLDKPIEIMLFRIVQELLNNAVKHADATQVDIQLIAHQHSIILMVEDDGKGFHSTAKELANKGFGIQNVRSRVMSLGGVMDIDSAKDRGTIITVEIPLR